MVIGVTGRVRYDEQISCHSDTACKRVLDDKTIKVLGPKIGFIRLFIEVP